MREKLHIKSKVMLQDLINGKYKLKHAWCFILERPNKSNQVTKSATFKK